MKYFTIIISLLLTNILSYGQVAVINDTDGYTNVRSQPKADAEVIYKLKDSEVFGYQIIKTEPKSNWVKVYIAQEKYQLIDGNLENTIVGYIHKSRLCPIDDLHIYTGSDFSFKYKLKSFNSKNKLLKFNGKWLTKINGKPIYGTEGNIPKVEVMGIEITINGKRIEIPKKLYDDIFECDNKFVINKNKDNYIVHQWNSDGAGAYLIVWVFGEGMLKQRLILIP